MPYKYATERPDFSDLASGRVFHSLLGHPAFPVRLTDEIYQRCLAKRNAQGMTEPCALYDPCCGTAYNLSVLAYQHWRSLRVVIGSDIDQTALQVARQNLGMLSMEGLDKRIGEITELVQKFGKESHQQALESARRLRKKIKILNTEHALDTRVFQANALDSQALRANLRETRIDIVLTDVPYGTHSQWWVDEADQSTNSPLWKMLNSLWEVLHPMSIIALVTDKGQKVAHSGYQRIEQFQIGKRRVTLLQPVNR